MVVWIGGRQLKRCRACGYLFAFKHHSGWYCSNPAYRASKVGRTVQGKPKVSRVTGKNVMARDVPTTRSCSGDDVRLTASDAKAALAELRAWMAAERKKW